MNGATKYFTIETIDGNDPLFPILVSDEEAEQVRDAVNSDMDRATNVPILIWWQEFKLSISITDLKKYSAPKRLIFLRDAKNFSERYRNWIASGKTQTNRQLTEEERQEMLSLDGYPHMEKPMGRELVKLYATNCIEQKLEILPQVKHFEPGQLVVGQSIKVEGTADDFRDAAKFASEGLNRLLDTANGCITTLDEMRRDYKTMYAAYRKMEGGSEDWHFATDVDADACNDAKSRIKQSVDGAVNEIEFVLSWGRNRGLVECETAAVESLAQKGHYVDEDARQKADLCGYIISDLQRVINELLVERMKIAVLSKLSPELPQREEPALIEPLIAQVTSSPRMPKADQSPAQDRMAQLTAERREQCEKAVKFMREFTDGACPTRLVAKHLGLEPSSLQKHIVPILKSQFGVRTKKGQNGGLLPPLE